MKVLLTGAAGELGTLACGELLRAGHEVVAVDVRSSASGAVPVRVENLLDPGTTYRLAQGCDAVVHLANHRHVRALPLAQQVLSENTTMNANVFRACMELGVQRLVFASTIQLMFGVEERLGDPGPAPIPYFPMDSHIGRRPQNNFYALSKELGERILENMVLHRPELCCTSLRFPLLVHPNREHHLGHHPGLRNEGLAHLTFADSARLISAVLRHQVPGYHEYFPAQSAIVQGKTMEETLSTYFPGVELRRPVSELSNLIDLASLERDLHWKPLDPPLTVLL